MQPRDGRSQQRRRLWPVVLLSPGRPTELLTLLAHDRGGRFQANADSAALVDKDALCSEPPISTTQSTPRPSVRSRAFSSQSGVSL
jgi:hypothetical protein